MIELSSMVPPPTPPLTQPLNKFSLLFINLHVSELYVNTGLTYVLIECALSIP